MIIKWITYLFWTFLFRNILTFNIALKISVNISWGGGITDTFDSKQYPSSANMKNHIDDIHGGVHTDIVIFAENRIHTVQIWPSILQIHIVRQSTKTVIFVTNKIYSVKNHIKNINGVVPINIAISSGKQYHTDMMKHIVETSVA